MWKNKGWIWSQDRRGEGRGFGGGLWDVLRGKGPDMYIGDYRYPSPCWQDWTRRPEWGAYPRRYDDSRKTPPWARRGHEMYDWDSRRYRPPPAAGPWDPPVVGAAHRRKGDDVDPLWRSPPPPGVLGPPKLRLASRHRKSMPRTPWDAAADWRPVVDWGNGYMCGDWLRHAPGFVGDPAMMGAQQLPGSWSEYDSGRSTSSGWPSPSSSSAADTWFP